MFESDIRFRIDDLFRESRIVIAFPQRDIHLDTKGPLEFKILDANAPSQTNKELGTGHRSEVAFAAWGQVFIIDK
jgi:small-conductance mechanosensitive channel